MHFSRAIHFLNRDEFRDIFDVFFGPSIARVEKYIENVEKFIECQKKKKKNIETNTRDSEWPG